MNDFFPEVVFTFWGIPVRDTVISTWLMIAVTVLAIIILGKRKPMALEMLVEFVNDLVSDVMQRPATPFLPYLVALFLFIAVANVFSILPVVVSPTKDINTPLALALSVFLMVHYYGVRANGFWGYLRTIASPIFMFPLEIIGQISRTVSLTLRLFGNIISMELVVLVLFALVPLFVPLPIVGFSLLTGLLQAYIFTALASVYIAAGVGIASKNKRVKHGKGVTNGRT